MNKNTFISELSRKLRGLPKADYDDAMNYYVEFFQDAGVDELADVTPLVGNVDDVADKILSECSDKQFEKVEKEGGVKNNTRAIWYVILGIFAAPVAFPLALTAVILIFVLFVVVFAVIVSLIAASVGIVFAGFCAIPAIFWAETGSQAMILLGIACVAVALGTLMCIAFYKIGELVVKLLIKIFRGISNKKNESKAKKAETVNSVRTDMPGATSEEELYQQGGEV